MLEASLARAEQQLTLGQIYIGRQREILAVMEGQGYARSALTAKRLLTMFEEIQAFWVADRDKLQQQLVALRRYG